MSSSHPVLKLTHDDNHAIYTRPDTTLVLAGKTFNLNQQKVDGFIPQRLLIYAHTVLLTSSILCHGKEVQIHCNYLQWAPGAIFDVSGKPGNSQAAVGAVDEATGQDGGSLILHVHNLDLVEDYQGKKGFSYWKGNLTFKVDGGAPGKYHKDDKSAEWGTGKAGKAGFLRIYYSNSDLRSFSTLYNAYYVKSSHIDKLQALGRAVPGLKNLSAAFKSCQDRIERLDALLQDLLTFHVNLTKCTGLLEEVHWKENVEDSVSPLIAFIKQLPAIQDYSLIPAAIKQDTSELVVLLLQLKQQPHLESDVTKHCKELAESFKLAMPSEGKPKRFETPLSELVVNLFDAAMEVDEPLRYEINKRSTPLDIATMQHITMDLSGRDDLQVPYPLVHPDQCQMELRQADAAFFADDIQNATKAYIDLRQRLAFAPVLKAQYEEDQAKPLRDAFCLLETTYQLSQWTVDSLANLYAEVCARLDQLSLGNDLFGLSPDWVPRLSTQYYMSNAIQQIDRLKRFEDSYWKYFDNYQDQMEAGKVLKTSSTSNMYRQKETRDTIDGLINLMREKESSILAAQGPLEEKRKNLADDLRKVQSSLKELRAPSVSSILSALGAVIVTGAKFWVDPPSTTVGLILGGAESLAPQVFSLWDEASNKIEDASGEKVDKNLLISKLTKCESDLQSLLDHPSYSMAADGIKSDGADTAKIMTTAEQIQSYIDQFKKAASYTDAKMAKNLEMSLKAYIDASNKRNQDMLTYNNAVVQSYQLIKQSSTLEAQAGEISSQLIKENVGLPSIVAFYQRYRDAGRLSALRTIKHAALALRFCGLVHPFKFTKGLLSDTDDLEAHVDILSREYDATLSFMGSFPQCAWPASDQHCGILYKLSDTELARLKEKLNGIGSMEDFESPNNVHTVQVEGLSTPVTLSSTFKMSPFSGLANVRLSQVRFWAPGLKLKASSARSSVIVEIKHQGLEKLTSSKNEVFVYRHLPVHLSFQYDWKAVKTVADISNNNVIASQSLASDWNSSNSNARVQAPIGPFANWTVTLRETDNGTMDWTAVEEAYLEFHGSGFPFQR